MKTTLDIDDAILTKAKAAAAREHKTLTRLVEEGLSLRLRAAKGKPRRLIDRIPISRHGGGFRPGIDPLSNKSIYDAMDDD